ncbi:MAG TPA: ATP-grasp domain-containing protein, partial [Candidatus Paceibacterota bacterium]
RSASDKLAAFRLMEAAGVRVPRYTTDSAVANSWDNTVFGRTRSGSKGRGIVVYEPGQARVGHALYSAFVENTREYRVHVCNGKVIRVQRKYLECPPDTDDPIYIQNYDNGFRFKQPRRKLRESREQMAVAAVAALGLDFGAVDLVIGNDDLEYVLEVNTAPACSPLTATQYVNALAELVQERSNGDYILHPNFAEVGELGLQGEDAFAQVVANG